MTLMHVAIDLLTTFSAAVSEGAWSDTSANLVSGGQEEIIFQGDFEPWTPPCVPVQLFEDPGFERSTGEGPYDNPYWVGASTNAGRPFCSSTYCHVADSGPHSGSFWVLFGGVADYELSSVYQDVVIPADQPRVLNYWISADRAARFFWTSLIVVIDRDELAYFNFRALGPWPYKQFSADVSNFADGNVHRIAFKYTGNYLPDVNDYSVVSLDDVVLKCGPVR